MNDLILNEAQILLGLKNKNFAREAFIDLEKDLIQCDCSGLIRLIISNILERSPRLKYKAYQFFDLIDEKKMGMPIEHHSQLEKGDLLIWRKKVIPKNSDTGHIAIIEKVELSNDRLKNVWIIDSTRGRHFCDDRLGPGIGRGMIKIEVSETGEMIGLQWSDEHKKIKRTRILGARLNYELVKDFF